MKQPVLLERLQNRQSGVPGKLSKLDENLKGLVLEPKSEPFDLYFKVFSLAGKEPTTFGLALLTAGLLFRRKQAREAFSVLLSVGGGWLINQVLKRIVRRPRPLSLNTLRKHSKTFSFPSAHTNLSVCYYGSMAWFGLKFIKRPAARIAWLVLMLFLLLIVGTSRVYRKEHHPTDVLGGYIMGLLWLVITLAGTALFQKRQSRQA